MKRLHKKLKLSRSTVRQLSGEKLINAQGALRNSASCWGSCVVTCYTCSCKNSVCNSCWDTDCCLIEP